MPNMQNFIIKATIDYNPCVARAGKPLGQGRGLPLGFLVPTDIEKNIMGS